MKVKELVKELQKQDQELDVMVYEEWYGHLSEIKYLEVSMKDLESKELRIDIVV